MSIRLLLEDEMIGYNGKELHEEKDLTVGINEKTYEEKNIDTIAENEEKV